MPAELTDQEFLGSPPGEQTDEQFFGKELTDAEFLGHPNSKSLTPETDRALSDTTVFFTPRGHPPLVSTEPRVGPDPNDPQAAGPWSTTLTSVGIPRPFPDKGENVAEQTLNAVMNFPVDAANFGLSPAGAVTVGAVPILHPAIQRLVAAGFTADQIKNAAQAPNWQDRLGSLLGAATTAFGIRKPASEIIKGKSAEPSSPETATLPQASVEAQPQGAEQPLNQPIEGVSLDAKEPDTQTSQILTQQGEPVVSAAESQVQAGDARQTSETSTVAPSPQVEQPVQEGGEPLPAVETGASAKAFEEIYGQGEIPIGEGRSPEEMFTQAQERMATGRADPYGTAARARTGAITPDEFADLVVEHDRLVNEAAAQEGTPNYESAYQQSKDFATNVLKPAETKVSDTMRAMQIKAPIDYTRLTGFRRALNERMGREMTPQEAPAFERVANDVSKARQGEQISASDTAARVQKRFARVKDVTFEDAFKQLHDDIAELTVDCNL